MHSVGRLRGHDARLAASYSFYRQFVPLGVPGFYVAVVLSIVLNGGGHGGGTLGEMLWVATPINSLMYAGLGVAGRAVWRMFTERDNGPR